MDSETLQKKTTHKKKRLANYRISRVRMIVENALLSLSEPVQGTTGTMEQTPRVIRDIVFTCEVLQNMLGTHQGVADGINS